MPNAMGAASDFDSTLPKQKLKLKRANQRKAKKERARLQKPANAAAVESDNTDKIDTTKSFLTELDPRQSSAMPGEARL